MSRVIKNVITYNNKGTDWSNTVSKSFQEVGDFHNYWSNISSCVRLYGGIIQNNGDGTVRVDGGGGLYKIEASSIEGVAAGECEPMELNSAQGGKIFYKTWTAEQNVFLTNNAYNYIFITWNHMIDNGDGTYGNTEIVASTNFYMADWENDPDYYAFKSAHPELNLPRRSAMLHAHTVGRVYKMDNEIIIRVCGTNGWNFNKRVQLFGEEFFPVIRARGLDIEPVANSLQFNVTEGVMWAEMANRFTIRAFNMELGDKFYSWYQHTSETTTKTLAQLNSSFPHGFVADGEYERSRPYDIFFSSADGKYYRDNSQFYKSKFTLDGTDSYIDYAATPKMVIKSGKNVSTLVVTSSGSTYTVKVNVTDGTTRLKVGTDIGGSELINQILENGENTVTFVAPDNESWIRLEGEGGDASVNRIRLLNETETFTYFDDTCRGNVAAWSEVLDYIEDKLIYSTTYPSVTELTAANPTGYYNMSELDPSNPGLLKDYVVLQLQSTDSYYKFNQDTRVWDYFGPKSTALSADTTSIPFIGDQAGMNTIWPNGFTDKVNVIISTLDNKYYEYSGVEGVQSWERVHGYVERNGWLRFYSQDAVDPNRYNNTQTNTLEDIPSGSFGVAWIYMSHDNSCHVVYGQDYYTAEGAKNASLPTPLPGLLAAYSTLVGKMTFTKGGSAFENAESPFLEKFISSGVSLHNDLAGLDGGDAGQSKYYHLNEAQYNNVVGATKLGEQFRITNTRASTSIETGAIVISGGMGISGEIYCGDDITAHAASDRRLKENLVKIDNSLDKISKLNGYTYNWNATALELYPTRTERDVGVIAQELQEIIPEAVTERNNGYLAVQYDKIIPLLIECVKELKSEIEKLKN